MDNKKSPTRRLNKRQSKVLENIYWDCSVCTYKNTPEAFKCQMCDVRKGTSTRKPRLNPVIAALQAATLPSGSIVPNGVTQPKPSKTLRNRYGSTRRARLRNIDRSTAQTREVTVNSVTVVITEYKPIMVTSSPEPSENSCGESSDSRN